MTETLDALDRAIAAWDTINRPRATLILVADDGLVSSVEFRTALIPRNISVEAIRAQLINRLTDTFSNLFQLEKVNAYRIDVNISGRYLTTQDRWV